MLASSQADPRDRMPLGLKSQAVTLIGMPGSGKTYYGKRLAALLDVPHLDTDDLIASVIGVPVSDLADLLGKDEFLRLEGRVVETIRPFRGVISTGGSVVYSEAAMRHLKSFSQVVFLHLGINELVRRCNQGPRGIVGDPFGSHFYERMRLYSKYMDWGIGVAASG